ncbi:glycosyltransferase 61 family protein [Pseudoponticoccus marisrubri]|uniref:Glycosyltransferase 61 catalytic domain-containing protein n=1 Tax=Pseudoponticoccus marisrubri TaxID=1685382 RepID=A0A0W7WFD7_9RHOB|nr:glycosyltransferase 61 family protein [Pseudoponticoccus marisrubri]KUF09289.1 hypothetical protein AVJ23_18740 [Pseudoponticoccus marisrubri]
MSNQSTLREAQRFPPHPEQGWSRRIERLHNPVVVPPATRGFIQPTGVLRANGGYCAQAALWRKSRPLTVRPEPPEGPVAPLPGRWLWGGVLWRHFGHFLVESTGRLWALPGLPEGVDGVLFVPKNPGSELAPTGFHNDFLALAGVSRVFLATAPVRPETLYVPGQGFGLGRIVDGTDHCRRFFRHGFARSVAPDGPERLFISRSRLGRGRGKLLCEDWLDRALQAEGYEVFHPQDHDLRTQIARYKAARQVIGTEGSALHLFAMVARPKQQLAVVARRVSTATGFILRHVRSFGGIEPLLVNTIRREWVPEGESAARLRMSELDFAAAQAALAAGGFVAEPAGWSAPNADALARARKEASDTPLAPI